MECVDGYRSRQANPPRVTTTLIERALLILGVTLIGSYAATRAYADVAARRGLEDFARERDSLPDQSRWSEGRIRAYALISTAPTKSIPLAVLHIQSIGLTVPVYADTSDGNLNRGAGLIAGTADPETSGNTGIAAHRDSFFRALQDIALGDRIEIEHFSGTRAYRVSALYIVNPDDMRPLQRTQHSMLTLVTCYPFYYVGSAPQRYIVRAVEIAP